MIVLPSQARDKHGENSKNSNKTQKTCRRFLAFLQEIRPELRREICRYLRGGVLTCKNASLLAFSPCLSRAYQMAPKCDFRTAPRVPCRCAHRDRGDLPRPGAVNGGVFRGARLCSAPAGARSSWSCAADACVEPVLIKRFALSVSKERSESCEFSQGGSELGTREEREPVRNRLLRGIPLC
eukprot:COSAG06_NODE_9897_length_1794_cov_1.759882_2_plen_182_part_00